MDFNIDSLLAILMPILAVSIGVAAVKKAIGCVVTLVALLVLAFLALGLLQGGSPA